ncbi:MAG: calcium/sodium antiporter [Planctomycetota bacterium]
MSETLIYILFLPGFIILVKGADWLVNGSCSLARRLQVSDLIVGLTIVAFGTSSPEFFVNIYASASGNTEIAIGNILGANIANIFLILGISATIFPLIVTKDTTWKVVPLLFLASLMVSIIANDHIIDHKNISELTRIDGLVLLAFFSIYLYFVFETARSEHRSSAVTPAKDEVIIPSKITIISVSERVIPDGITKSLFFVFIGLVALFVGSNCVVNGAVTIAKALGVSESFIGLTIVAIGTSSPELVTSVIAALKKNADISVGNAVGSCIFNVFAILGTSVVIRPMPFNEKVNSDIIITILSSILLFFFILFGKKYTLSRRQGVTFLILYVCYIIFLIMRG